MTGFALSSAMASSGFFDEMRIQATAAIELIKNRDHHTREQGRDQLHAIEQELRVLLQDIDHNTRDQARELAEAIQRMKDAANI